MKRGFTLAEVLITLTIIGVIAAITIPNLIQSWKKHQVEVGVKEAYSILNNTLTMAKTVAPFDEIFTPVGSYYYQTTFAENYIIPFLKINIDCGCKDCGMAQKCTYTKSKIVLNDSHANGSFFWGLNGYRSNIFMPYSSTRYLKLANGMNLYIYGSGASATFIVDINGNKYPNMFGYDLFAFTMFRPLSGSLQDCRYNVNSRYCNKGNELLAGTGSGSYDLYNRPKDSERQNCSLNGDGRWCAGVIMYNGWKIPDDYPIKKF